MNNFINGIQDTFRTAAQWGEQQNVRQYLFAMTAASTAGFGVIAMANGFMGEDPARNACIAAAAVSGLWSLRELASLTLAADAVPVSIPTPKP